MNAAKLWVALPVTVLMWIVQFSPASAETITRKSSFGYDDSGMLIRETVEPDLPNYCLTTNYTLDGFGNRTTTHVSACNGVSGHSGSSASARATTATYSADGAFPTSTINALGHVESRTFLNTGDVATLTGPNGLVTSWEYDSFGRKTKEIRADGTYSSWQYLRCSNLSTCPASLGGGTVAWVTIEKHLRTSGSANWPEVRQYFDTLMRVVRVQREGFAISGTIPLWVQDTEYDALGRVKRKSNSYDLAQGNPSWTEFEYDALGRVTQERRPDPAAAGSVAITSYQFNGLTSIVTNPKGGAKTTHKNSQGKISSIADEIGGIISYSYDAIGNLTQTNAGGSVTTVTYDQRGAKTGMTDPSAGSWVYANNVFGDVVWQRDSLGRATASVYDKLGRLTKRTESDLISEWSYDKKFDGSICGLGLGKLCESKADNGYRKANTYDSVGRISSVSTVLDNATSPATVSVVYSATTGRVIRKNWPTGYGANFDYTSRGYPYTVNGGGNSGLPETVTMAVNSMDPSGNITEYVQGGKVTTNKSFDAATGRLAGIVASKTGGATGGIISHGYTYDTLDNLVVRADSSPGIGITESFSYDSISRLRQYLILGGGVTPPVATDVLYDVRGNITYKSDVGQYHYDPVRQNRLQSVSLNSPAGTVANRGTRALSFGFDDGIAGAQTVSGIAFGNGNVLLTTSKDSVNSKNTYRSQSYTSFNMPLTTTYGNLIGSVPGEAERTLTFAYGPEHQRIKQQVILTAAAPATFKESTIWYLNGEDSLDLSYEKEIFTNGLIEHRHFVRTGGIVFAVWTTRSGTLGEQPVTAARYFHHDNLGSIAAISDESGSVVERLAYDPWGKRRLPNGLADPLDALAGVSSSRGYTMHEHLDEVGAIHMNGRVYDPLVGRFLSADPFIQSPSILQSYNRYSYVLNNPLAYSDPTGYFSLKKLFRAAVAIVVGYVTGNYVGSWVATGGAAATFTASSVVAASTAGSIAGGAAGGFAAGVIGSGSLKGGITGAITGGVFGGIGSLGYQNGWSNVSYVAAHSAAGCVTQAVSGGACKSGALSAGFAKWATVAGPDMGSSIGNGVKAIVVGGFASQLAGGKFEHGATTAAYAYLFNELLHQGSPDEAMRRSGYKRTTYRDGTVCPGNAPCYSPFGDEAAGQSMNANLGLGASFHVLPGVGLGGEVGVASDSLGRVCGYANICYTAGPGMMASAGLVGGVGTGALSSGTTDYRGATWAGGNGAFGTGSVLFATDGNSAVSRSVGGIGVGVGGGVLVQTCRNHNICSK